MATFELCIGTQFMIRIGSTLFLEYEKESVRYIYLVEQVIQIKCSLFNNPYQKFLFFFKENQHAMDTQLHNERTYVTKKILPYNKANITIVYVHTTVNVGKY